MLPRFALSIICITSITFAAEPVYELPKVKPLSTEDALKAFDVPPGFRVELVASEPLVRSPVAMDFDENGRLYVVEYRDYNQFVNPKGSTIRGCIKLLEDTDGDGVYDKATIFVDDLESPVAVACWDGGVFVGVVPDLWYFKDTDGDGKADVKRKVLTGFDRDKAGEAMLNSFRWGLDNRFHIATGPAGGNLRAADDANAKPVSVRRQNILFDPRTGKFEATSGGGQHGMTLDDWGDTFVCDNSNPVLHISYDSRYAARNPFVVAPPPIVDVNAVGKFPNLRRISPPEPWREARTRLRKDKLFAGPDEGGQPFGFFTGTSGVTVYRGDAFPPEYRGNVFVGEVANNLVYRAKLEPKGLGWSAVRAEKDREFLASKDIWFRPVQFANPPDGTLYVIDMYRELIETAVALPPQMLQYVDVAGGIDHGRIWRVVPEKFERRKPPSLGKATTAELVALLEHSNGWHRDTAARLLFQRQDKEVVPLLKTMAKESKSPLARMHALYSLHGMNALKLSFVCDILDDSDPRVREHALRLTHDVEGIAKLIEKFERLASDPEPRVRLQLAFTMSALTHEAELVAKLARKDGAEPLMRLAILCITHFHGELFEKLVAERKSPGVKEILIALASQAAAANRGNDPAEIVKAINALPEVDKPLARELVQAFVAKLPTAGRDQLTGNVGAIFKESLASARKVAVDEKVTPIARAAAIRTLALASFIEVKAILAACLGVKQPPMVQLAALDALARFDSAEVPAMILAAWPSMSPAIRATATETLLSRSAWLIALLDAVEKGTVKPSDLDPARVQLLMKSPDAAVAARVAKLFGASAPSKRLDVLAKYQKAIELKGDAVKGKAIFKDNCSACHKLEGVGDVVGPDLASIKNRGTEAVLTNILDPNREVLPQYYTYLLTTDTETIISGMIAAETANTVTIRKADGRSETVQRVNILSLKSTGLSAMPEGMEAKIDLQAMADLLAYLGSIK
jgi:putative membrane-bound dehydrogenase-like protein